jgi:hypothetical protein
METCELIWNSSNDFYKKKTLIKHYNVIFKQ